MSLHEDITRRLDELEALARRAYDAEPGPWALHHNATRYGRADEWEIRDYDGDSLAWVGVENDARLIVHVASPDVVLRAVAEDREVLKRHQRVDWYEGGAGCWYCSGEEDEGHRAVDYPCPEVLSLARRLGVTP